MFVCQAGGVFFWGGGGGEGRVGFVSLLLSSLILAVKCFFFILGGVMCVWDPVFASVGSGNIISV